MRVGIFGVTGGTGHLVQRALAGGRHDRVAGLVRQHGDPSARYDFGVTLAFTAAVQHYLFGRSWDQVAHSRGSDLFVDGIHLSDRSGAEVIDLTGNWLATALRRPR
ncbi:hypothetical protein [Nocardia sp. NPDC002869]|uniref:hypothetical protein n=1 Tax=Nocardia sp. NPDC002869 TaxID=3161032 RepID=UPI00398D3E99